MHIPIVKLPCEPTLQGLEDRGTLFFLLALFIGMACLSMIAHYFGVATNWYEPGAKKTALYVAASCTVMALLIVLFGCCGEIADFGSLLFFFIIRDIREEEESN